MRAESSTRRVSDSACCAWLQAALFCVLRHNPLGTGPVLFFHQREVSCSLFAVYTNIKAFILRQDWLHHLTVRCFSNVETYVVHHQRIGIGAIRACAHTGRDRGAVGVARTGTSTSNLDLAIGTRDSTQSDRHPQNHRIAKEWHTAPGANSTTDGWVVCPSDLPHCTTMLRSSSFLFFLCWYHLGLYYPKHGVVVVTTATATPCTRHRARSFQQPDCYLPPLNPDMAFADASFVMSHDAATGYLHSTSSTGTSSVSQTTVARAYSQTQPYQQYQAFYQQLDDGARALDIRPYLLLNGTVIFQHGSAIRIPVALDTAVQHVIQWCTEHPDELVVFLPSHFLYQSSDTIQFSGGDEQQESQQQNGVADMVTAMSAVFDTLGVQYYECSDVYGLTVQDVLDMSTLPNGGNLLVLWNSNYGRSCLKENWVEDRLVTCYPATGVSCTQSPLPWTYLQTYLYESAFGSPTDAYATLGPPASTYRTPLNELQALWQVNTGSVVTGLARASSLLVDNRQSHVNARVVRWIYELQQQQQNELSGVVVAVDNVQWHGNALLSVLRNQCSQVAGQNDDDDDDNDHGTTALCGTDLPLPSLRFYAGWHQRWTPSQWLLGLTSSLVVVVFAYKAWARRQQLRSTLTEIVTAAPEDMAMCYHRECGGGEYGLQTTLSSMDNDDDDDADGILMAQEEDATQTTSAIATTGATMT